MAASQYASDRRRGERLARRVSRSDVGDRGDNFQGDAETG